MTGPIGKKRVSLAGGLNLCCRIVNRSVLVVVDRVLAEKMDASALLRSDPHQLVSMLAASNSDSNITKTPEPNRGGGSSSRPSPSPTKQRFGTTGGGSGSGSGSGGSGAGGGVGFSRQSRSREGWKKLNDLVEHSLDAILPAARERVVAKDAATPIAVSGFGSTTPARKPLTATLAGLSGSDPHHTAAAQRAHYLKLHPSVAKYKSNSKSPGAHADARSAFMWNPNADGRGGLVFQKQLKELWANTAAREPPAISTLPGAGGMGSAADALGLGEVGMASVARSTASGANRERELVSACALTVCTVCGLSLSLYPLSHPHTIRCVLGIACASLLR